MTEALHNITVGTIISPGSGTKYGFPSGSFTYQKQPTMPTDQKAKLLAMHRDGKANAGIYVAVVLVVYFVLVTLLFCRYGRRRRSTRSEPVLDPNSLAEQGRLQFLTLWFEKNILCSSEDGCCKCISGVFQSGRCSSPDNVCNTTRTLTEGLDSDNPAAAGGKLKMNDTSICQKRDKMQESQHQEVKHVALKIPDSNEDGNGCNKGSNESKSEINCDEDQLQNESEESTEED